MKLQTVDDISKNEAEVNLRKHFPIGLLSIVRRSLYWIAAYLSLILTVFIATLQIPADPLAPQIHDTFIAVSTWVTIAGAITISLKLLYEYFYYRMYHYDIERGHLVITTGVFLRHRSTIPFSELVDISLGRDIPALILQLYDLFLSTASGGSSIDPNNVEGGAFRIEGLSVKTAVDFQDYLARRRDKDADAAEFLSEESDEEKEAAGS